MSIEVALSLKDKRWKEAVSDVRKLVKKACEQAFKFGNAGDYELPIKTVEVSLVLSDDKTVQELNKTYRNQDKPTNVLSFAALDDEDEPVFEGMLLGDIIIAFETTEKEAIEQGKPLENHLFHLVVHGVLHLLGYDHLNEEEAQTMEALECLILEKNGIKKPYEDE